MNLLKSRKQRPIKAIFNNNERNPFCLFVCIQLNILNSRGAAMLVLSYNWGTETGRLVTYAILLPHMPVSFMTSLIQTVARAQIGSSHWRSCFCRPSDILFVTHGTYKGNLCRVIFYSFHFSHQGSSVRFLFKALSAENPQVWVFFIFFISCFSLWLAEFRSCVKVEVAVLGSPSLIVLMVSVDVKQHWTGTLCREQVRVKLTLHVSLPHYSVFLICVCVWGGGGEGIVFPSTLNFIS